MDNKHSSSSDSNSSSSSSSSDSNSSSSSNSSNSNIRDLVRVYEEASKQLNLLSTDHYLLASKYLKMEVLVKKFNWLLCCSPLDLRAFAESKDVLHELQHSVKEFSNIFSSPELHALGLQSLQIQKQQATIRQSLLDFCKMKLRQACQVGDFSATRFYVLHRTNSSRPWRKERVMFMAPVQGDVFTIQLEGQKPAIGSGFSGRYGWVPFIEGDGDLTRRVVAILEEKESTN